MFLFHHFERNYQLVKKKKPTLIHQKAPFICSLFIYYSIINLCCGSGKLQTSDSTEQYSLGVFDFLVSSLHYMTGYQKVRETKSSIGKDSLSLSPRSRDLELASSLFLRERERKKKASWYNAQDSQEPFNFGGETLPLSNSA